MALRLADRLGTVRDVVNICELTDSPVLLLLPALLSSVAESSRDDGRT